MAKKMSKGGKQFLSLIFHLVVLFVMVSLYDTARAVLKKDEPKSKTSEASTKDAKSTTKNTTAKKTTAKKDDSNLATKPIARPTGIGSQIQNKVTDTKGKMEERGTSMADLLEQKKQKEKAKAAAEEKKE